MYYTKLIMSWKKCRRKCKQENYNRNKVIDDKNLRLRMGKYAMLPMLYNLAVPELELLMQQSEYEVMRTFISEK